MPAEIRKVTKLTDYKWLNLFDVEYINRNGEVGHWTFASRKKNPVPGPGPSVSDAVVIVPIHTSGKLVTIREFRIPLGDYENAFPAGLVKPGESPEEVAGRELEE